ncbi:MAG: hypothetical protein ACYTAO_22960 [Planctomycetota bacterium]
MSSNDAQERHANSCFSPRKLIPGQLGDVAADSMGGPGMSIVKGVHILLLLDDNEALIN